MSEDTRVIKAEVHSDDRRFEIEFDAEPWFVQANDDDVLDLADCGWGGGYPSDYVALHLEDENHEIGDLMTYCRATQGRRDSVGFECHVDEESALVWLAASRPELFDRVKALHA